MATGYIYILTNDAMPGVVKVGRTERPPETRSKELQTTGVPQPFKIEYQLMVGDCHAFEKDLHLQLEKKGRRISANREFFNASVQEVVEIIDLLTDSNDARPDFFNAHHISSTVHAILAPYIEKNITQNEAENLARKIETISRKGYPEGLRECADLFYRRHPSSNLFKHYFIEYLYFAREGALHWPLTSGGVQHRKNVGKAVADFVAQCYEKGWLMDHDFKFVSEFLIAGDQFQYEGYSDQIIRYTFPSAVLDKLDQV